ncbi:MAG: hypothetical protein KGS61_00195 [Verrucomicrobia bacterium]|nr:hypothetical protein [Verrucomicrobiota bacterium]
MQPTVWNSAPARLLRSRGTHFPGPLAGGTPNPPRARFRAAALWLILLAGSLPSGLVDAATFPLRWHWSNPTPHGNDVISLAGQNGLYVEVTDRGQLYTSNDLSFWIARDTGVTNTLQAVTFFGSRLLASGEDGLVLYADSLDNFQSVDLGTTNWLEGLATSTNLAVAVGDNAAIYTSPDGAAWQLQPQSFTAWLRGVAYGSGLFVTVGEGGFIATSADGTNWNSQTSGTTANLNAVAWVTNGFWIVGDIGTVLTSASGLNWQTSTANVTNTLFASATSDSATVVAGDGALLLQTGGSWSNQLDAATTPSPAPTWTYYTALWDGTSYLVGGRSGMLVQGVPTNGLPAWQPLTTPPRNWLWDVTRTPGFYVAVGDHANILTSEDGYAWTLELTPDAVTNSIFLGVGGSTNLLVAVGNAGTLAYSPNVLQTVVSTNTDGTTTTNLGSAFGVLWYPVTPTFGTNNDLQGVAALGNLVVVTGGNGTILTSPDGTNWTARPAGAASGYFLSSVAASPTGLVAAGDNGCLLTSATGTNWTLAYAPGALTTNWIYRVRYLNGQWVAVGQNGLIAISTDSTHWTLQDGGTTHWLNDVAWLDHTYFATGNQGTFLASGDGISWTNLGTITEKSLYGLSVNGGQLLAVGVDGTILRSQVVPVTNSVNFVEFSRASGQNLFLFSGQLDQRFTLDSSVDLTNWLTGPVLEFYDDSGTLLYLQNSNTIPAEFQRTILSP